MSCRVRIMRESNPASNYLGEYVVGFDGRFIGNLQIGGSIYAQANPGFHYVTFTIAAHPNRRLSIYVPEDVKELTYFTRINPLNHEVTLDQNRAEPERRAVPQQAPAPAAERREEREQTVPVRRTAAPPRSHTLGAVSLALGAAGLFNAFFFHNYVVAIAALFFGLVTLLASGSQRPALGIAGIVFAAAGVAAATLLQTGLAAQSAVPQPATTQSVTEAAERMKELSPEQDAVIYDGEGVKATFRRLYEVSMAEGECYLQLKTENKSGGNALVRLDNVALNGAAATATGGLSALIRPGEIVTNPYVISFKDTGVNSLSEVKTLGFELVLYDGSDMSQELFRSSRIELTFAD